jgi:NAD+ synthase (glutamine-hydrolysing)
MPIDIALGQINVIANRPKKNLEQMLAMSWDAIKQGKHLIAFPEMAVKGYLVGDKWLNNDYCRDAMQYDRVMLDASAGIFRKKEGEERFSVDGTGDIMRAEKGIAIAYGNIYLDEHISERVGDGRFHPNEDGRIRRYNGINVFQFGKRAKKKKETKFLPEGFAPKTLLPNYRMFDDKRYFHSLLQVAQDFNVPIEGLLQPFVIDVDGREELVGLSTCEDMYIKDYRKGGKPINIAKMLIQNGARTVINCSTSPWTYGKVGNRDRQVAFLKKDCEEEDVEFTPFYYVNPVGAQNNGKNIIPFDGASTVYGADGKPKVISIAAYRTQLLSAKSDQLNGQDAVRNEKPKVAQKLEAVVAGLHHIRDMIGIDHHPLFMVGASGGIDSSLTLYALKKAVNADKVLAINMPTPNNEQDTIESANLTADRLDIKLFSVPITGIVKAIHSTFEQHVFPVLGRPPEARYKITDENIQAKARGTDILSNMGGFYGAVFTNNGNKNEFLRGYATLYGDVGGVASLWGDFTKAELFELARYINDTEGKEIISEKLIPDELFRFAEGKIPPKAGLDPTNRVDPMFFGYECALIDGFLDYNTLSTVDVMKMYQQGTLHEFIGAKRGRDSDYGHRLMRRWEVDQPERFVKHLEEMAFGFDWAVFKHVQAPPIIDTSKSAFGFDYRESILPHELTQEHYRLKREILAMPRYVPAQKRAA